MFGKRNRKETSDGLLNQPFTVEEMDAIRQASKGDSSLKSRSDLVNRFWTTLKKVKNTTLAESLVTSLYCTLDPKTPHRVRLTLLGALGYFVLPLDAIPDFLPVIGFTDDAAVLLAALGAVRGAITDEHREKAKQMLGAD